MKYLLLPALLIYSNFSFAEEHIDIPSIKYDAYFSASGPLTKEMLLSGEKTETSPSIFTFPDNYMHWASTYIRCHYQIHNDAIRMDSDYKWGVQEDGNYYQLPGFWWTNGLMGWGSMFYTDLSHDELKSICLNTFKQANIAQPPIMISAANNSLSFNHEIWNINQPDKGPGIDRIVSFGDSLSDTRNMFNGSLWKLPNRKSWFLGRFTNGKVWVEYLSGLLNLPLYNWATGGAAADSYFIIPGLLQQVESWLAYTEQDFNYRPEKTLFTILIGGNDIVQYGREIDDIISHQEQALKLLAKSGAREILILNLPDVSKSPIFKKRNDAEDIRGKVNLYNNKLIHIVDTLKNEYGSNLKIKIFDFHALFNDLLSRSDFYGFENIDESCLNIDSIEPMAFFSETALHRHCTAPEKYVFWDMLHPSTQAHQKLANFVSDFVMKSF